MKGKQRKEGEKAAGLEIEQKPEKEKKTKISRERSRK